MQECTFMTPCGIIHYWLPGPEQSSRPPLVFLPGLTADHRLFEKQLEYFSQTHPCFVWDAPGHAASRPFSLTFDLRQKATWLHEILNHLGWNRYVLVGQSMGGYVSQCFLQYFPEEVLGFVCIDSAPLQRHYYSSWELWALDRTEPLYRYYPWKSLLKAGSQGVATTSYGRNLMREMMETYADDHKYYAKLAGHGYGMLSQAVRADLPYRISCPALLICGKKDHAGSCIRYNKNWEKNSGIPIHWIDNAGHNSNTDAPKEIHALMDAFLSKLT